MLIQKSPQYANMPHQQWTQTEEGQRGMRALQDWENWQRQSAPSAPPRQPAPTNQFGSKAPDMSAYKPGAAQPMQSQPQGTPYGAYSPPSAPPIGKSAQDSRAAVDARRAKMEEYNRRAKMTAQERKNEDQFNYDRQQREKSYAAAPPPPQKTALQKEAEEVRKRMADAGPPPPLFRDGMGGRPPRRHDEFNNLVDSERVWRPGELGYMAAEIENGRQQREWMLRMNELDRIASGSPPPPQFDSAYAAGTDPRYMAANPDDMPFRPGMRGDAMGYPRPSNTAFADAWNNAPMMGMEPTYRTPAYSFGGEGPGNLAYMPDGYRPPPFQAAFQNFDGSVTDTPLFGQRDALIQNINDRDFQYMAGMEQGPQQYDFGGMWRQAGDMVADGWQNPLAGLFNYG